LKKRTEKSFFAYMYCESWMANRGPECKDLGVETLSKLEVLCYAKGWARREKAKCVNN